MLALSSIASENLLSCAAGHLQDYREVLCCGLWLLSLVFGFGKIKVQGAK